MAESEPAPLVRPGSVAAGPAPFERIAIVGLGLIGGSVALAARRQWPSSLVIGVDHNDVLEQAIRLHAVDVAASDLTIVSEAQLVVLAAPIDRNVALLAELPGYVAGDAIVTDVSSTKRGIVDASRQLPPRLTFIGGHPLAGAAAEGIAFARPDLFTDRPWIFTPDGESASPVPERLQAFVRALGARPTTLTPDEHDRVVAFLSHLPQLVASALMNVVGEHAGDALSLAGPGLVDTTRLAGSPAAMWQDICRANADHLGAALALTIDLLMRLRADLDDGAEIGAAFEGAREWRARLLDAVKSR